MFFQKYHSLWRGLLLLLAFQANALTANKTRYLRPASLKFGTVNLRCGPGDVFPVLWVLTCQHLPVQILREYGFWREICAPLGTRGWVHKAVLSAQKTVFVQKETLLREKANAQSRVLARITPPNICYLLRQNEGWLYVKVQKLYGFITANTCWQQGLAEG
jgi:SH3-like domain-containing protein